MNVFNKTMQTQRLGFKGLILLGFDKLDKLITTMDRLVFVVNQLNNNMPTFKKLLAENEATQQMQIEQTIKDGQIQSSVNSLETKFKFD